MIVIAVIAGLAGFMFAAIFSAWILPLLMLCYVALMYGASPQLLLAPWVTGWGIVGISLGYGVGMVFWAALDLLFNAQQSSERWTKG